MDRVTKSLLKAFQAKFDFSSVLDDSELFEHFVNYIVLEKRLEDSIDNDLLDQINIGKNGTFGLDGFCLLINKIPVFNLDDLNYCFEKYPNPTAEVYFLQIKTSTKFEVKEVGQFGDAIVDFISETPKYKWSENANKSIELIQKLINNISKLEKSPICHVYYCTLGDFQNDQNLIAKKENILNDLNDQRVFSKIEFEFYDFHLLHSEYKKIGQKITKTFDFKERALIPEIEKVDEAYIGVIPAKTVIDLITLDGKEDLLTNIFYDNVRDFQGYNKVNGAIKSTLEDEKMKLAFSVLNNGITIVSESISHSRDKVTISNYQIINGLQTSKVLFDCKELIDDNIYVPLKLIVTKDDILISNIIKSTNRQTEVKEEDLIAYSDFQKRLEDYYKTYENNSKLLYERRSKQYNNDPSIDRKVIIDKNTQIKAMGSFFFYKPHLATRFFGALFSEFGKDLFNNSHQLHPYYTAGLIFNKLDNYLKSNQVDKKYRKLKYFILMMMKFEVTIEKCPNFDSKKSEKHCTEILQKLSNEDDFKLIVKKVLEKLERINIPEIDLDSTEISKSSKLTEVCKNFYFN